MNPFTVNIPKDAAYPAEILIYGPIGAGDIFSQDGIGLNQFKTALNEIPRDRRIKVRINSEGGNVWDGLGIYHLIDEEKTRIDTHVDGVALSIASVIAMAGGHASAAPNSLLMIHDPWTWARGNARQLREEADVLDKHGQALVNLYIQNTGRTETEIRDAMAKTTWFLGSEAVDYGLLDSVTDTPAPQNLITNAIKAHKIFALAACPRLQSPPTPTPNQGAARPDPMKSKILALLAQYDVALPDDATDEQILAAIETLPAAAMAEADELEAQLTGERQARIETAVDALVEAGKIPAPQKDNWIRRAMDDESILADVAAMPAQAAAPAPCAAGAKPSGVSVGTEGILDHANQIKDPRARYQFRIDNWDALRAAELRAPRADNTLSSTLVTSMLADGAITNLQSRLAPLKAFTRDFGSDRIKPMATVVVGQFTSGPTVQTDATSFESGDVTKGAVSITMHQYTSSTYLANSSLSSGHKLADQIEITVANLADKIMDIAAAPITTTNFATGTVTAAAVAFGHDELKSLWGTLKKSPVKNILLDGEYYARFLPDTTEKFGPENARAFGWDGLYLNTRWTGAEANVVGFACNPQAIACAAGLPIRAPEIPSGVLDENIVTIPSLGLSIAQYAWINTSSRRVWLSYDVIFGAAVADTTAGVCVKSQ